MNPFLQISDIIVGCLGSLVRNYLREEEANDFAKEVFQILKDRFVGSEKGKIRKYGIVSNDEEFYNFLGI